MDYAITGVTMSDFTLPCLANGSIAVDSSPILLLVLVSNSHLCEVTGITLVHCFVSFFKKKKTMPVNL